MQCAGNVWLCNSGDTLRLCGSTPSVDLYWMHVLTRAFRKEGHPVRVECCLFVNFHEVYTVTEDSKDLSVLATGDVTYLPHCIPFLFKTV